MDLIINLNKPGGITSQEATSKIKKILGAKKAGHTGTLDPSATGVLLVCTNRATRFAPYFSPLDKRYRAVMKLGERTDTQDAEGKIIEVREIPEINEQALKETLHSFTGKIFQTPPMFSALKHRGKPLYRYAQRGVEIPRKPRTVFIHTLEIQYVRLPFVCFDVACSKGTYIRTLCHDIGERLKTGGHLFTLERTAIASFGIQDSVKLEELQTIIENRSETDTPLFSTRGVYTIDRALSWMPDLNVRHSEIKAVKNGNPIRISRGNGFPDELRTAPAIKVKSPEGDLLAVGHFSSCNNEIRMDVVLAF